MEYRAFWNRRMATFATFSKFVNRKQRDGAAKIFAGILRARWWRVLKKSTKSLIGFASLQSGRRRQWWNVAFPEIRSTCSSNRSTSTDFDQLTRSKIAKVLCDYVLLVASICAKVLCISWKRCGLSVPTERNWR